MSIPIFLIDKLNNIYGNDISKEIIDGFSSDRNVTLRVNTLKANKVEIENELLKNGISFCDVPWYDNAFVIENLPGKSTSNLKSFNNLNNINNETANIKNENFKNKSIQNFKTNDFNESNFFENEIKKLDIYNEGKIYLQSLSSMIPPLVMDFEDNEDILDMCSAPGGKTCEMSCLNNNTNITACELNSIRFERLKYNIEKQGANNVTLLNTDSRRINNLFKFDSILLDAPCSGSGTLTFKNDNKNFTELLIDKCVKSQKALIDKAFRILKNGKTMVYSTCSILPEENEEIINYALEKYNFKIVPIKLNNFDESNLLKSSIDGTILVKPTNLYEGFFVAKLLKSN